MLYTLLLYDYFLVLFRKIQIMRCHILANETVTPLKHKGLITTNSIRYLLKEA
jgi:hypothetical protein